MKKVLFVIESLGLGGAEKSLVTLLNNLDYAQLTVDLMLVKPDGIFVKYVPENVSILEIPPIRITIFERILYKLYRMFNFKKLHHAHLFWKVFGNKYAILPHKYDIAIAYNQGFATYFVEKYTTANIKYAWVNTDYKKAGYKIFFDFPIYSRFSKIIAVSEEVKCSIEGELRSINKILNVGVVKDIVDDVIMQKQAKEKIPQRFTKDVINIVSVGRLATPKAFSLAVKACDKLIKKNIRINWVIIGEGQERQNLERLIAQYHLQHVFFLFGATDNPYPYMNACDIFVQTSLFEGLGTTLIEASCLNKPIVTTNFPSAYAILEHEKTGLICEMNEDAIARSIERLINDEDLRNRLVGNLKKADRKSGKEATLQQINELLELV
ncbi:MAG: glycosyltransferase [Prevotellaceae bacterium]|jgi:glycosyltransferase involved in cell wall biosynthesis|nr:glycosyltransferase [Prevotellaceae bacterium]